MADERSLVDLTPAVIVAENAARLKRERGISLSEIARRAEVHRTHVSLILRGRRMVQIDTVVKLAGALEAEPADLLAGIAWMPGDKGPRRPGAPPSPGRYQLTSARPAVIHERMSRRQTQDPRGQRQPGKGQGNEQ
jgi:transcriptional regulator with XRE-family HTH domain